MKALIWVSTAVLVLSAASYAAIPEMELESNITFKTEPLTIDKIAEIDPGQPNPQLRRWVLDRQLTLGALKTHPFKVKGALIGVEAHDLQAKTDYYVRGPGPWYQRIEDFPCSEKPDPAFATPEGAKEAAKSAAKLWENLLSKNLLRLSAALSRVNATRDRSALSKAARVFEEWQIGLDRQYREQVINEILPAEWRRYEREAKQFGLCKSGKRASPDPEKWMMAELDQAIQSNPAPMPSETMNPDTGTKTGSGEFGRILTRAPSRRWDGLFGVRMDIRIADRVLDGQFVIKPNATGSVLSPSWLRGQGVPAVWIEVPEAPPLPVRIGAGEERSGLAHTGMVEDAVISNYKISQNRFLLFESDLYDQPENFAPCCSGVLGRDFLRRNVVEFRPSQAVGATNEVILWPVAGFNPPSDYTWVEAYEGAQGTLQVACTTRVKELGIAKLCEDPDTVLENSTGSIIYDLPHGRIWYSAKEKTAPSHQNRSGVSASYVFLQGGDRVLQVTYLGETPGARALAKDGLKVGSVITEVDSLPTSEMDLWEVKRRFEGIYGDTISLKWRVGKSFKMAPLAVGRR